MPQSRFHFAFFAPLCGHISPTTDYLITGPFVVLLCLVPQGCTARMYGCNFPRLRHFWPCICLCRTSLPSTCERRHGCTHGRTDRNAVWGENVTFVTCYVLRVTFPKARRGGRNLRHSSIRPSDRSSPIPHHHDRSRLIQTEMPSAPTLDMHPSAA